MALSRKSGISADYSPNFLLELRERAVQRKAEANLNDGLPGLNGTALNGDTLNAAAPLSDAAPELLEELRIHQIELEMQNEELRLAQTDLETSRARYFDLYDLAPVGYVTLDNEGAIVEMNLRATALLAVSRGALNGRSFSRAIAAEDQDTYYLSRTRLRKTGEPQFCELRMIPLGAPLFWARLEMSLRDEGAGTHVCRIVIVDITQRKTAELQVQESERQLRQQADAMPQIVWTALPTGQVDYFNERWFNYTGSTPELAKDDGWQSLLHPADLPACLQVSARGFATATPFEFQCRLKRASDGAYRWHLARAVPYCDPRGALLRWFGTFTDIHEQETTKERLESEVRNRTRAMQELKAKEDDLRRLLNEKETLINEVHHRVKNNLQVISSLLRMQGDLLPDHRAAAALKASQHRIASMAHIHELLYSSQFMDEIDFAEYTHTLVNELIQSYSVFGNAVTARFDTMPVFLKVDQAIPCGLILNELVTNALKYAYPPGMTGEIMVDLRENAAGLVTLSVADSGVGLPDGFDWQNSKSMGLPIVDLLTTQIAGTLQVRTASGSTASGSTASGSTFAVEFLKEGKMASAAGAQS
jgi:PAS domain S-box-containing protein